MERNSDITKVIFGQFGIEESYVQNEFLKNNVEFFSLLDEQETKAQLIIDWANNEYVITTYDLRGNVDYEETFNILNLTE